MSYNIYDKFAERNIVLIYLERINKEMTNLLISIVLKYRNAELWVVKTEKEFMNVSTKILIHKYILKTLSLSSKVTDCYAIK